MNRLLSALGNGFGEVLTHKLRSLLTISCVLLGVSSLVVTVGFMEGLFAGWERGFEETGGLEKVSTGDAERLPERQEPFAALSRGLTQEDALALRELIPDLGALSPEFDARGQLSAGNNRFRVRVQGVTNDIFEINRYVVASGRMFTDLDQRDRANVIVIGTAVAKELFPDGEEPLGRYVNFNGAPFLVVGVLEHYERLFGVENLLRFKNQIAFIPLRTMADKIQRSDKLTWLNFKAASLDRLHETVDTAGNILAHRHRGLADFELKTNEAQLASYTSEKTNYVVAGAAVAGVSLLVSGLGIMNLMLASINERVREIGIRKAIGATPGDVFVQFLVEAVLLSMLGGISGILVAAVVIDALVSVLPPGRAPVFAPGVAAIGFAFSVAAGVLAGIYPAVRAATLDPIEALRYE